ncbi:MAG TPA: alkaline phosphatase family protein [Candidatus Binatia bacterium]|nr:alkaline phosphatase family protein [Candidatus Binatia bacterium]
MLGFDGADPRAVRAAFGAGRLPALAKLAARGAFRDLATTTPPESPVAWTTFATGLGPASHGVLGLVDRDPATYRPRALPVELEPPTFFLGFPVRRPAAVSARHGDAFWQIADRAGVASAVLDVPFVFPPDALDHGRVLAGDGVPDLRGTTEQFTLVTTEAEPPRDPVGGAVLRVAWAGNRITTQLPGLEVGGRRGAALPLVLERAGDRVHAEIADAVALLEPGRWSDWIPLRFPVSPFFSAAGLCRVLLVSAAPDLRLYVSAIGYDPRDPYVAITSPDDFAPAIAKSLGLFDTVGWSAPTAGLDAGAIDEVAFLADVDANLRFARALVLREIDQRDAELVVAVFTHVDRIAHMFYRFTDPLSPLYDAAGAARYGQVIDRAYDAMDQLVEDVLGHLPDTTDVIVLSDHGFQPFRRGVNLNTWLEEQGWMKRSGAADGGPFAGVDWSATSAYALGIGQIYLNLRGREASGTVAPGADAETLLSRIADGLAALADPATGERGIARAERGADLFRGPFAERAPDLLAIFAPGYRSSFATALGASPPGIVVPNDHRWSGDHGGSSAADVPGIAITSFPLQTATATLVDVAPTVLSRLGVPTPASLEGRALQ